MYGGLEEKEFSDLHAALAKALKAKILSGEVTAAELKEAREFLKDNGVDGPKTAGVRSLAANMPVSLHDDDEVPLRLVK